MKLLLTPKISPLKIHFESSWKEIFYLFGEFYLERKQKKRGRDKDAISPPISVKDGQINKAFDKINRERKNFETTPCTDKISILVHFFVYLTLMLLLFFII